MKKNLFMAALMLLSVVTVSAKVWRVNPNSGIDADFKSIQEALDAANKNEQGAVESLIVTDGDTLYCEPGSYGDVDINRPITLIGAGFGDITNGLQLGAENCAVFEGSIILKANNINLIGLVCNEGIYERYFKDKNNVSVYPEYCSIERCLIRFRSLSLPTSKYTTIKNCYFSEFSCANKAQIINNIFALNSYDDQFTALNSTVINNTFIDSKSDIFDECYGSTITDNIILFSYASAAPDFTDNTVHNNIIAIAGGEAYETYPNNIYGTNNTKESLFKIIAVR